jgi:hypothetical protein
MKKIIITENQMFGKLTAIKETEILRLPSGQINRAFLCKCECGKETVVRLLHLVRGRIVSCGCISGEQHGKSKTSLYRVWTGMKARCYDPNHNRSHRYMSKGIVVCDVWKNSFATFEKWAIENGYGRGLQIDRINNDGNYEPSNCRFVTIAENCNNRDITFMVDYNGKRQSLMMILHEQNKEKYIHSIYSRIKRGWNHQEAIDKPLRKGNWRSDIKKEKETITRCA